MKWILIRNQVMRLFIELYPVSTWTKRSYSKPINYIVFACGDWELELRYHFTVCCKSCSRLIYSFSINNNHFSAYQIHIWSDKKKFISGLSMYYTFKNKSRGIWDHAMLRASSFVLWWCIVIVKEYWSKYKNLVLPSLWNALLHPKMGLVPSLYMLTFIYFILLFCYFLIDLKLDFIIFFILLSIKLFLSYNSS
jgi:hypothetical protein